MNKKYVEEEFARMSPLGKLKKDNSVSNYEKIEAIMLEALPKKVWWFAYEFVGRTFTQRHGEVFISYEISARLAEMVNDGFVITARSEGKLNLYRLPDHVLGLQ